MTSHVPKRSRERSSSNEMVLFFSPWLLDRWLFCLANKKNRALKLCLVNLELLRGHLQVLCSTGNLLLDPLSLTIGIPQARAISEPQCFTDSYSKPKEKRLGEKM
jgi:hypothetical protein